MSGLSKLAGAATRAVGGGCLAIGLIVLLSGATEGDWGNRAAKFVDTEVHGLSTKLAGAELESRWQKNIFAFQAGLLAQIAVYDAAMSKIEIPTKPAADATFDQLQLFILDLHGRLRAVTELESQLADTSRLIEGSSLTCNSENVFSGLNLDSILKNGMFSISLPDPEFAFGYNSDPIAIVKMIFTDIVGFGAQQQNETYNEALERLPSRLISESELFALSKRLCNERRAPFSEFTNTVAAVIDKQRAYLESVREVLNSRRVDPERRFLKEVAARVLSDGDLSGLLSGLDSQATDSQLLLQMLIVQTSVGARLSQLVPANCVQNLADTEDIKDFIAEAIIEVQAIEKTASSEVSRSAHSLGSFLQGKLQDVATARKATVDACQ